MAVRALRWARPIRIPRRRADPTRRRILELLARSDRSVGQLTRDLPISQPAVSRHLRVLREAGLVSRRGEAQRRVYRLEPDGLCDLEDWVTRRRRDWSRRLDALAQHLDARASRRGEKG